MIEVSLESNKRAIISLSEKKSVLEKSLKDAEEKHKIYLSKLSASQ